MNDSDNSNKEFVEVTLNVTMSKSVCIEVPTNSSKEDIENAAKGQITPIYELIRQMCLYLKGHGIGVKDMDGWVVSNEEYVSKC